MFDDYVYYHAFSGTVDSVQKTGGVNDRRLVLNAKCMKRLLENSKLAVKPSVVSERNIDTNLFNITPYQTVFALDSVRVAYEKLIQAKGPTERTPTSPLNSDTKQAERHIQTIDEEIQADKTVLNKSLDELNLVISGSVDFSTWFNAELSRLTAVLARSYGIILRAYNVSNSKSDLGFPIRGGFSGNIGGEQILNTTEFSNNFLNEKALNNIKNGVLTQSTFEDFNNTFTDAGFTKAEEFTSKFISTPSTSATSVADVRIVAFLHSSINEDTTPKTPLKQKGQ